MLTLKPSTRLSAAKPSSRRFNPLRPNLARQAQRRIAVAAAGGAERPQFDDRGNPSSGLEGSLKEQQTGTLKGGPADVMAYREIETSDTNPAMDPSEKANLDRREGSGQEVSFPLTGDSGLKSSGSSSASGREGSGMDEAQMQFRTGGEVGAESMRDQSDQSSAQGSDAAGGGSSSKSHQRTDPATGLPLDERAHPVARTSGTAIGSAVGTVLGAVGGPVGAAVGAALGASAGRGLTDLTSGTRSNEQAAIYAEGAEPEQVLEEVMGVGSEIKERTEGALDKAEGALDDARPKADKRMEEGEDKADHMSKKFDDATSDMKTRSRSDESSSTGSEGGSSSKHGHSHGSVGGTVLGAAEKAAKKLESATGSIPLPEYPPSEEMALGSDKGQGSRGTEGTAEGAFEGASGKEGTTQARAVSGDTDMSSSSKSASDRAVEGGWGEGADSGMSGKQWVGDWGSEAATSDAASKGLASPAAASGSSGSSAGGSGLGGLGDAEEVVKSDVGVPSQAGMAGGDSSAQGWKPQGVGRAGGVAAAGGYGSETSAMEGDAGFSADQQRSGGGGGSASLQPASAVGNAGQDVGEKSDFEAGGGVLDGVAGRVSGLDAASESLMEGINSLSGVAGASYEGMPGMQGGQGEGQQGSGGMGQQGMKGAKGGSDTMPDGIPEGRLRVGGEDAQAAISVDGESNAAITGDSVAQRVEQVYGISPEASPGVAEAKAYKAEAKQEGKEDHGQSTA